MPLTPPDSGSTRKRKRAAEEPNAAHHPPRQRPQTTRWSPPPTFFDNLSKVSLCTQALREFNRRTQRVLRQLQPSLRELSPSDSVSLKRLSRLGGPCLDDIRSCPDPNSDMPSRRNARSDESGSAPAPTLSRSRSRSGKTSAYNPLFEQHLIDHHIFPHDHDRSDDSAPIHPNNLDDINNMLAQPRASLSPPSFTPEDFRKFEKSNNQARTEAAVMSTAFQTIIGTSDIPTQQNLPFGNLIPLTDGTLTVPQPDFYDGCRPKDIRKAIRDEFSDYIIPSTKSSNLVLPNFFAEGKGPGGNAAVSKLQACYDAAFGARAMHAIRSYVNPDTAVDGNAYTISATYNGGSGSGTLTLYTTHPVASQDVDRPLEYHMTQLNGWHMTGNPETFRQGAAAIRNAREWAQEQRTALVTAANAKIPGLPANLVDERPSTSSQSITNVDDADTSADELTLDHHLHKFSSSRSLSSTSRSRTSSTARSRTTKRRRSPNQG